jgi:hypothetical protein
VFYHRSPRLENPLILYPGNTKGEKHHCTVELLFDWFGISCITTDNFCSYLQNRLIRTGGQLYIDTFPFTIPCFTSCSVGWSWAVAALSSCTLKASSKSRSELMSSLSSEQSGRIGSRAVPLSSWVAFC